MRIIEYNHRAMDFFSMLPEDWQIGIVPHWKAYQFKTKIYVFEEDGQILGGGLIFDDLSPDMEIHKAKLNTYLCPDSKYLGFIWIDEKHRSKGLGKKWLKNVIEYYSEFNLWLSIEDESLKYFYQKLGFKVVENIKSNDSEEWIMYRSKTH